MNHSTLSTNATRVLENLGVSFSVVEFPASDFTAEEAVEKLAVPPAQVFKTLVARGDRTGPLAAVIPSDARLSLKKLARESGNRTVTMVPLQEMEKLTGYVKGGCSPFGMKKKIPLYIHLSARGLERIFCSAGRRGVQLVLAGDDFIKAAHAVAADLAEE